MKKCYSRNEEEFGYNSVDEAVSDLLDDFGFRAGETTTLWEGDAIQNPASHYLGYIAEDMQDRACDECGEYAEGWDFSKAQRESLQEVVSKAVDRWASENNLHPHFYTVENVVKFTIRFTDDDGGFEILRNEEGKP